MQSVNTMQIFSHAAVRERMSASGEAMPIRKKKSFPSSFSIYFFRRLFPLKIYCPCAVQTLHLLTLRFPVRFPVSESQHKVKDLSQGLRTVYLVYVTLAAVMPTYALCTYQGLGRVEVVGAKIKTMMFLDRQNSFMYFRN